MVVRSCLAASIRSLESELVLIALASFFSKESALDDPGRRTLVGNTWKQLKTLLWPVSGL